MSVSFKESLKSTLRETLIRLNIDLTKNLKYDRLTRKILQAYLKPDYNCVDVGCHKGEIMDLCLTYAPKGKHIGFEPIPYLYQGLCERFESKAKILPYALAEANGTSSFQWVKNAPAYSGLKRRRYDIENPEIEEIQVELRTLNEVVGPERIDFLKIDVEGGELGVLKGGLEKLKQDKPLILFEFGKGASDFYKTRPEDIFNLLCHEIGLRIYNLKSYANGGGISLEINEFKSCFDEGTEYYFVAAP